MKRSNGLPLVSIVTPSYKSGQYIEETIKSIQAQSYPRIEYIIIDGGSTDETAGIVSRYPETVSCFVSERDEAWIDLIVSSMYWLELVRVVNAC